MSPLFKPKQKSYKPNYNSNSNSNFFKPKSKLFKLKPKNKIDKKLRIVGELRQNQLITSMGIGSIVDFVYDTVIIGGVDNWDKLDDSENAVAELEKRKLYNENLQALTGVNYFLSPKANSKTKYRNSWDIPSYIFPEMLHCPVCKRLIHYKETEKLRNPHRCHLTNQNGKECNGRLVPSRFVVVCENGHIEDFPYSFWVHHGKSCSSGQEKPRITMFNIQNRSDAESLFLKCESCGEMRSLDGAFSEFALSGKDGYPCSCNHPHLQEKKRSDETECQGTLKTRLRTASGVYFPVSYIALSIPPWSKLAVQCVAPYFDALKYMTSKGLRQFFNEKKNTSFSVENLLDAFNMLKARKNLSNVRSEKEVYYDEYSVLCNKNNQDEDEYSSFSAEIPIGFENFFDTITIVDKLTVIQALKGFTRLNPLNTLQNSE
jgi:hypothetical protein